LYEVVDMATAFTAIWGGYIDL